MSMSCPQLSASDQRLAQTGLPCGVWQGQDRDSQDLCSHPLFKAIFASALHWG